MNLDAVRDALLADAHEDARRLLTNADREIEARLAEARDRAAAVIERGRAAGAREADERLARRQAATRREARQIVLAARRAALDQLRERAGHASRSLAGESRYPKLVEQLRALAVARLGADAIIEVDPDGEPGVLAHDEHRRVDLRLATLAARAVDDLGAEVATLWS